MLHLSNSSIPYHERVDVALAWLNGSEGVVPDFISLYFSNVDSMGHAGGPDSLLVGRWATWGGEGKVEGPAAGHDGKNLILSE